MKQMLNQESEFKSELHHLFNSSLSDSPTVKSVEYLYPCIPSLQEINEKPEFVLLVDDNVKVDFLVKNNIGDLNSYIAYHEFEPQNSEHFNLMFQFFKNRNIELLTLPKSILNDKYNSRRTKLQDFKFWLDDEDNNDFYHKNVYYFTEQISDSKLTLSEEIKLYSNNNTDLNELLEEMCKYLLSKELIEVIGSNPLDFNNKFICKFAVDEFDDHFPF